MTTHATEHAYTDADLTALQDALARWIQASGDCGYCHTGDIPHRIYNGLRGRFPRGELVRIWRAESTRESTRENTDEIIGFIMCYPRHEGFDAFVSPDHRGQIERTMLERGYAITREWMNREGLHEKPVITDVFDCDEKRAVLLRELGFVADDSPWLAVNEYPLEAVTIRNRQVVRNLPRPILPDGFIIRHAHGIEDAEQLAAVHSGAFGSNWTPELYRDEVMRKPGYDPADEWVVVAPDGTFAAFCILWRDDLNRVGIFEPVGTHETYQRRGLGRALLAHGLRKLREDGYRAAQVCNELDNAASQGLYRGMGFEPKYLVTGYVRP